MQWYNKDLSAPETATLGAFTFGRDGLNLSPLAVTDGDAFLKIRLTSVMDVKDEVEILPTGSAHTITADGASIGTMKESTCPSCGGFKRDFSLTLPLSFYFENLTGEAITPVTPRRLYQEDGAVIFSFPDSATGEDSPHGKMRHLLFVAKNCVLHTEGKQLLVTVKAGEAKWRFRPGKTKEELIDHFLAKHGGK